MSDSKPLNPLEPPSEMRPTVGPMEPPPEGIANELRLRNAGLVPATAAGMPPTAQLLHARVDQDGSLIGGFGVVASFFLFNSRYQVVFTHDVTQSTCAATVGAADNSALTAWAFASVVGRFGNSVYVDTWLGPSYALKWPFYLLVAT